MQGQLLGAASHPARYGARFRISAIMTALARLDDDVSNLLDRTRWRLTPHGSPRTRRS